MSRYPHATAPATRREMDCQVAGAIAQGIQAPLSEVYAHVERLFRQVDATAAQCGSLHDDVMATVYHKLQTVLEDEKPAAAQAGPTPEGVDVALPPQSCDLTRRIAEIGDAASRLQDQLWRLRRDFEEAMARVRL